MFCCKHKSKLNRTIQFPALSDFLLKSETIFNEENKLRSEVIDVLKLSKDYPIVISTGFEAKRRNMSDQSTQSSQDIKIYTQKYQNHNLFILILILMSTSGLVGSDAYLPNLPEIGNFFQQDAQAMQLTLAIYLVGLSVGQLILGPLTDAFGRKKLLLIGMSIFFLASFSCALSLNYTQMLISRLFQALGASSGLIIGRAMIGDKFNINESGKIFATIFPFVGLSPAISPFLGGFIGYYFGWRSTFLFVSLFAFIVAFLVSFYLPETLEKNKRQPLQFLKVFSAYPKLIFNKKFISYAIAPCTAYIVFFAYIATTPFILNAYGYDERMIGSFSIALSLTYVIGNLMGKKLLNYFDLDRVLSIGFFIFSFGGFLMFLVGILSLSFAAVVIAISVVTLANGFLIPLGTAGVIGSFSKNTGYASGLLGFLQLGAAALSTSLIGVLIQNSIQKLTFFIFVSTILGTCIFLHDYFQKKRMTA